MSPGSKKVRKPQKKAVALRYDRAHDPAPTVLAKGMGPVAEKIIALARENNIPIQENSDLVEILAQLEINDQIPPSTYLIVAEILAFVYRANESYTP
jgi:flagellar biosynthesis protein